ncbi:hypothetical protein QQ045_032253 [Rhodiola kirilowii]
MAEIVGAAASVISIVLKLSEDLYKEVKSLKGVKGDIKELKEELRHMEAYLKDVDESEMSNSVLELVSDVRRLTYAAENIIDTFSLTSGPETCAGSWCIPCCSSSTFRSQLENLMAEAKNIESRRARYANVTTASDRRKSLENLKKQRVESSYAPRTHDHMVGLEDTIDFLADKLTSGGSDHHFVMSILGMGGLGKTTLARRLYNKLSGRGHFQARAWICVSQDYDPEDLLLQLITMIIDPKKDVLDYLIKTHSMEKYLCDYLEGRCFLVVIDDVWDIRAWERIHGAFPQNNINSRIIITTRNKDVAQIYGAYVHEPRGLDEKESWELFCRKSFPCGHGMTKCPANLETVGKEMVKKCDGLPLALVTLGGLLSRKSPEISEWEAVSNNLWDELKNGSPFIDAVLTLSYRDLPYNLKKCFLYIGMFPEDSLIPISILMLLWEAEGFIGEEGGRLEDISKTYFKELVGRSLLQEVGHSWIPRQSCRIHDLLRDLAIRKAKETDFSAFYCARQRFSLVNEARPHIRLAMSYLHPSTIPSDYTNDCLRTFRLRVEVSKVGQSSVSSYISVDKLLQSIDGRFNLLRVLDIEVQGSITNLQLGKMIHLKYLGIKLINKASSVKLPETIGNLKALQTIYIRPGAAEVVTLPKTMVKLQNLKHIIGCHFHFKGDWIGKLRSLEALEFIESNKWCEIDASDLVNLRRLKLRSLAGKVNSTRFYLNFLGLTKLHTLVFIGVSIDYPPGFFSNIFKSCPSITHFTIVFYDPYNGDMLKFAKNLIHLEVHLINDILMIAPTERFAELRFLRLSVMHTKGPMMVMTCSEDGFPQLRTLIIKFGTYKGNDADLKLEVAEGGMPLLTTLQVNQREQLIVPERLEKLIFVA